MGQLKEDVVKLLTASVFVKEVNLLNEAQQLLDEFVDSYKHLGTKFHLSDMDGISFPVGIKNPQLKADMGMLWSVLNGLRYIWTCTPKLDEISYSENAFVIEAVSRILTPIFGYCSIPLTCSWGEQTSESSRFRKEQMRAMASPNKPDLCIRLEDIAVELIFCEFSSLEMGKPKHRDDWRKSEVEDLLERALHLKTFIEEVVCGVKKVLDESVSLPVDDNEEDLVKRAEALTISTTPYSPNAKHY
ncbi:6569_t:CDS:2 [Paraglomus brasilianum]|uniref:6569_t:CDS:1 n=1 Tax=Paraglomus brasilianum TaxID=144538 RepID=A0A9N9DAC3_9GLOM|nr:6569_t:CDS:2 [Paraglomus brasilianum]